MEYRKDSDRLKPGRPDLTMDPRRKELLIDKLDLKPHPEGGYFNEVYRSDGTFDDHHGTFPAGRSISTSIYYLLGENDFSHFHRIRSDEVWHHYEGASATIHIIHPDGRYESLLLGKDLNRAESPQLVVPAGAWFGVTVNGSGYLLAGCTVAPGFDFKDFEIADKDKLIGLCPDEAEIIDKLTLDS